jgi:diguanylate cyclase (GGDEF)-like protein
VCFDVDRFSRINETMGRNVGDQALQRFGERLLNEALSFVRDEQGRKELIFAHIGGDKFLLGALGLAGDEDVALVARGMQAAMRHPFVLGRREIFASVSAGLSLFPRDGANAEELIANAESAVRHAKADARGSLHFFSLARNHQTAHSLTVENGLRRAIERDELRIHFQPQMDAVLNEMVGVETLVRWQHPERGLLAPAEFIHVAEETGLIVPIGEWVLRTACEQMQELQRNGVGPFMVGVNLSPRQLRDKELIPTIKRILERTGFPARGLDFEITETGMMSQALTEISVLHELKKLGANISVDDFGTGYSSLSYLTRLPIDTVKIDRTFVSECTEKGGAASIVQAIIAMAGSLRLATIAEGVTTSAQVDLLQQSGCRFVQGFLFGKPMPVDALGRWLKNLAATNSEAGRNQDQGLSEALPS